MELLGTIGFMGLLVGGISKAIIWFYDKKYPNNFK